MKILFLVPYPQGKSPSQRFRFEQYFGRLTSAGHQFQVKSFLSDKGWDRIYTAGWVGKSLAVLAGFGRRLVHITSAAGSDLVFIHREAAPLGPPIFEWLIAKVFGKKIIYDFDDAIWMTDSVNDSGFRWRKKVSYICGIAYKVSCGNEYLCSYARRFNQNVFLIPTTIDTGYHQTHKSPPQPMKLSSSNEGGGAPLKSKSQPTIGWTGSHTTLKYLDDLIPAIQQFPETTFLVIANKKPNLPLRSMEFIKWSLENEIADLSRIDIGVMPLPDDEWSKGKCGFKILQYMAMGIPALASPVGVNTTMIKDGVNGFLCSTTEEWIERLSQLIKDPAVRKKIGEAGRKTVEDSYSVNSNSSSFLLLFG